MKIKRHTYGLPPRIMMDTHPIRLGTSNHKNIFTSWTGLSYDLVQKYLTKYQSTIFGHLQKPRKGLRPTQEKVLQSEPEPEPEPGQDQFPPSTQSEDTNIVFLKTVDLIGKFTRTRQEGYQLHPERATSIY